MPRRGGGLDERVLGRLGPFSGVTVVDVIVRVVFGAVVVGFVGVDVGAVVRAAVGVAEDDR